MSARKKITPCLWFNFNAEEAVNHYLSIFKRSNILQVSRYGDAMTMLNDPDADKATRVMQAMMTMRKIDVARLQQTYDHR